MKNPIKLALASLVILAVSLPANAETIIITRGSKPPLTAEVDQHGNLTINPEAGQPHQGRPQLGRIMRQGDAVAIILPGKPPVLGHSDGKGTITIDNPDKLNR